MNYETAVTKQTCTASRNEAVFQKLFECVVPERNLMIFANSVKNGNSPINKEVAPALKSLLSIFNGSTRVFDALEEKRF
ncbi:hypothetical protein Y032_0020g94 [Ancylostoma ceylanicum]|uniref:Uncharacterized protein n=1 Tax=Ancylostoma ceylanicum TaxID=53326 RepID=A0A016V1D7_9BILA|nr:hypothetical protein Y032_0020g94 [Ancylostoma ceylanicum]